MKLRRLLAAAAAASLFLAGCSNASDGDPGQQNTAEAGDGNQANDNSLEGETVIVLVSGDRQDQGFHQLHVEGLEEASERLGFDLVVQDMVDIGNASEAFENAARQNPALIISGGAELYDGFSAVCENPQYSDIDFWSVADFPPSCEGAVHYNADSFQVYYLTGVVAGLLLEREESDSNLLGAVAGPELTFSVNHLSAMEEGLTDYLPEASMRINFTGDFDDAGLAREAAEAFIAQNAGVLTTYLSSGQVGAIEAAAAADTAILAANWDGCERPEGNDFAGATIVDLGATVNELLDQYVAGDLGTGNLYISDLSADGVAATICDVTDEEQQVLDDIAEQLVNGEIEISVGGFTQNEDGTATPRDVK